MSLPDFDGFVQAEFNELTGVSMHGQVLAVDFLFPRPIEVREGPISAELFLQTGPHNPNGDYPYTQYVVFGSGSRGMLLDQNGYVLNESISATQGVLSTDHGWAGANLIAYPTSGVLVAGIHFELTLPDTGESLTVGRIGLMVKGGTVTMISQDSGSGWSSAATATEQTDSITQTASIQESVASSSTGGTPVTEFSIPILGATTLSTDGQGSLTSVYGRIHVESGTTPSGIAVISNRQAGFLLSEVAIPASPVIKSGRTYVEASSDGLVNTAILIANPTSQAATIEFEIRDAQGVIIRTGTFTVNGTNSPCAPDAICNQLSSFVDGVPFLGGKGLQGTLTFTSSTPISATAIRVYQNENTPSEPLMTNQPIIDLSFAPARTEQVVPHFFLGNGMNTRLMLVNPTGTPLYGTLEFMDNSGSPMLLGAGGSADHTLFYSVPPNGAQSFSPEGLLPFQFGSVWVVPNDSPAPGVFSIVSYKPQVITVAQAAVPVTMGTSFRMYVQLSDAPKISTGITIANATDRGGTVTLSLTNLDGDFIGSGSLYIGPRGQILSSIETLIPSLLSSPTRGILRITTDLSNISVTGFRHRLNERQPMPEPIFTTITPVPENGGGNSDERIFPQVLDGGGFTTELILYSGNAGDGVRGYLDFIQRDGTPLALEIH